MWSALTGDAHTFVARPDAVAELKGWAQRVWWAEHRTPRERARAIGELAAAPWRFAREAARVVPAFAPFVAGRFRVPVATQLGHLVAARAKHGLDPIAYYRFQLFRSERWRKADQYVQTGDTRRVLRWLVTHTPGYAHVFADKRDFERWCVAHALPAVPSLMVFEDGRLQGGVSGSGPPPIDLFSKPSNAHAGSATDRWLYRRDGSYVSQSGRACNARGLVEHLARLSVDLGRPMLVQPALRNASRELPLTPGGLCTVRITTVRYPQADPQALFAAFRIPAAVACAADNFGSGGISCPVDLATGRLQAGIRKDPRVPDPIERHPVTGALLPGHQLSWWPEALELALRAHRAIASRGVPVIGWDVAPLEEGPLLVEGNNVPCSTFAQMVLQRPLGDLPIVDCINAHLRECFRASAGRA